MPDEFGRHKSDHASFWSREYWMARGVIPRWQLVFVYMLICTAGVVGFATTQRQGNETERLVKQNRELSVRADRMARETAALTRQIQQQREQSIRSNCKQQNDQHDETIRRLNKILREQVPDRAQRRRIRAQNVFLIEGLAPVQDCDKLIRDATGG